MSKKFNNKTLLALLAGLIIIFALVKWYQATRSENTLNPDVFDFDTAKISKIELYPTSYKGEEIIFSKDKKTWQLQSGKIKTDPDPQAVANLISMLKEIKPQRLITRDKKKWAELQLTDTSATKVKVYSNNKLVLNLFIGKFTYQQSKDPYGQMQGGGITGTSYVRLADEDKVYAVEGFLTFSFNQPFKSFRNQTISRLDKPNIIKFTFKYLADSGYTAMLKDGKWQIDGIKVDSAKVEQYLNTISYKSASSFNDNFKPTGMPNSQLFVETKDNKTLVVDAYLKGADEWNINSNYNPKSWFNGGRKDLYGELFKGKDYFKDDRKASKKN